MKAEKAPLELEERSRGETKYYIIKVIPCSSKPRNVKGILLAGKGLNEARLEGVLKKRLHGVSL